MQASDVADLQRTGAPVAEQQVALETYLAERGVSEALRRVVFEHTRTGIVLDHTDRPTRSCLGGPGLLPSGEQWPHGKTEQPLTFIGAFDLGELPTLVPLPATGTLLFYWDHEFYEYERMDFVAATRVYYVPEGEPMEQHAPPEECWGSFDRIALGGSLAPISGEAQRVVQQAGEEDRAQLIAAMNHLTEHVGWKHHLLGTSLDIQGPALEGIEYVLREGFAETQERFTAAELAGKGWMLLAQINEDEGLGIGDGGALYFLIPEEDLRAAKFDRVIGDMQCH